MGLGENIKFFLQNVMPQPLGEIWEGAEAANAYQEGKIHSKGAGKRIRIAFRNLSSVPVLLCWVSEHGNLHHFYKLGPCSTQYIRTNRVTIVEGDHVETTFGGHAFCIADVPEEDILETQQLKSLEHTSSIIGGYRPFLECQDGSVQVVTISRGEPMEGGCCVPGGKLLRKRKLSSFESSERSNERSWFLHARPAKVDPTPFDTTGKEYKLSIIGGWPVYLEHNWHEGDEEVQKRLQEDLRDVGRLLPSHAVEYLRQNCPIWVNSSIKYGPKACPTNGRGCCYHPNCEWLKENGLSERKHQCVEINEGKRYMKDWHLWGPGGIMLHELSHAYHHRLLPGGYGNKEIKECFEKAMKEGLYDCVRVHGSQGPEAKAYACTNEMEYFAELSTAFLGGKGSKEYNKWFPFNREQLREHDPRAYHLLARLWKVNVT